MVTKISTFIALSQVFLIASLCGGSEVLISEDFRNPQTGLLAPVSWFDSDLYSRDGKWAVSSFTFLSFDFGRKPDIINNAGGFVIELEVSEIGEKGQWAGISIGQETVEIQGGDIALILQSDMSTGKKDQAFSKKQGWDLEDEYCEGQKIRIELFTKNVGDTGKDATANVYFDETRVISDFKFQWDRGPTYLCLDAGGRAVFDNVKVTLAEPDIEFVQSGSSAPEYSGVTAVNVVLNRPLPGQTYSVDYAVTGGTADNGGDFTLPKGTLTFSPGESTKTINIDVKKDSTDEYDETIQLSLSKPTGKNINLGPNNTHTHTIIERWPIASFEVTAIKTSENSGSVKIPVILSHPSDNIVILSCITTGGDAEIGSDYVIETPTLNFAPGQTAQEVSVKIVDDKLNENSLDETITIALADPKGARLGNVTICTIGVTDNEPGIEFDGGVWIPMYDKHSMLSGKPLLFLNEDGHLEWTPTYAGQLTIKLSEKDLSDVGDVAEYAWLYMAEGPSTGSGMHNLVERWGSGDFRWGVFDSGGQPIDTGKTYSRTDDIFGSYTGYHFRSSPHVPKELMAGRWGKRKAGEHELLNSWHKKMTYYGNSHPVGEFTPLIIRCERIASDTVVFSVTQNGVTQSLTDSDTNEQPRKIDSMAINYPNPRPFKRVVLAPMKK